MDGKLVVNKALINNLRSPKSCSVDRDLNAISSCNNHPIRSTLMTCCSMRTPFIRIKVIFAFFIGNFGVTVSHRR